MARICAICGKGKFHGNQVSHSNKKARRTWSPNLQKVKAVINDSVKSVRVCTVCLKSGRVTRAL
jgi:large subunit ribosomal protein L28